jgi:hypothetical protein
MILMTVAVVLAGWALSRPVVHSLRAYGVN